MPVYVWEEAVISWMRQLPHSGELFAFFKFFTDFRESEPWLLLLVVTLGIALGWRTLIVPISLCICAVAAGDVVSRRVVKYLVERPRPNFIHEPLCNMSSCWGFVSSHCTNVAAAATVLCLYNSKNCFWTIPIVTLVALSRLYLIDHYPLDVIGGVLLGFVTGILINASFRRFQQMRLSELPRGASVSNQEHSRSFQFCWIKQFDHNELKENRNVKN